MIVHIRADQLLPQLIMEPSDILPPHYRHTGHLHEEVDNEKLNFDKMAAL